MILALAIAGLFVLPDPWRVVVLALAVIVEAGEVFLWIRFLHRYRVTTGTEGMIGEQAEVIEPCAPRGRVRFRGEIWNARCRAGAGVSERVRIAAVDGLELIVEREADR